MMSKIFRKKKKSNVILYLICIELYLTYLFIIEAINFFQPYMNFVTKILS